MEGLIAIETPLGQIALPIKSGCQWEVFKKSLKLKDEANPKRELPFNLYLQFPSKMNFPGLVPDDEA